MILIEGLYKCYENGSLEIELPGGVGWATLSQLNAAGVKFTVTEMLTIECETRKRVTNLEKAVDEIVNGPGVLINNRQHKADLITRFTETLKKYIHD